MFKLDINDITQATRVTKMIFANARNTSMGKNIFGKFQLFELINIFIIGSAILIAHDWEIGRDIIIEIVLEK